MEPPNFGASNWRRLTAACSRSKFSKPSVWFGANFHGLLLAALRSAASAGGVTRRNLMCVGQGDTNLQRLALKAKAAAACAGGPEGFSVGGGGGVPPIIGDVRLSAARREPSCGGRTGAPAASWLPPRGDGCVRQRPRFVGDRFRCLFFLPIVSSRSFGRRTLSRSIGS